jgi:hypothetical protein
VQIYRQSYCPTRRRHGHLPFVSILHISQDTGAIDDDRGPSFKANPAKFSKKSGLTGQYRPLGASFLVLISPSWTLAFGIVKHFYVLFLGGHS